MRYKKNHNYSHANALTNTVDLVQVRVRYRVCESSKARVQNGKLVGGRQQSRPSGCRLLTELQRGQQTSYLPAHIGGWSVWLLGAQISGNADDVLSHNRTHFPKQFTHPLEASDSARALTPPASDKATGLVDTLRRTAA